MKYIYFFLVALTAMSCSKTTETSQNKLEGSWELLSSVYIKKDTIIRNDAPGTKMIKILNRDHFGFFLHSLNKNDSARVFSAGGGTYTLQDSVYKEHLEFCSDKGYEGNDFEFTIAFHGDTLIQEGIEKLNELGIGQENLHLVEKYLRVKEKN